MIVRSAAQKNNPATTHLPAQDVLALEGLHLRARCVADGVLAGMHRSQRKGESAEFAEHKLYAPGDDTRRIDWKALAKSDRLFVKRFEEETSLNAYMLVDHSGSMAYAGEGRHSKLDYAATLAASLSLLLLRQSDAVGLLSFNDHLQVDLAPSARRSHIHEITTALEALEPSSQTKAKEAFRDLARHTRRHSLIVIFSDLLAVSSTDNELSSLMQALAALSARGADVCLFHVLDPDEIELPHHGVMHFFDMESEQNIQVDADAIRETYREEVEGYINDVQRRAHQARVSYHLARSDAAPAQVLTGFIAERGSARRR